ncbi:MAG TPA: aminotransferase class III-fold pyridoxal phosphate-dependent enzyme [Acidobacteriota bacterium]|nr:aminotransferase class III-fold pyridoxal phosphate-dependent enzyme [Acidobacteriota bacterium]
MDERSRWAREVAGDLYGVEAVAEPLAGERDDNFRLRGEQGGKLLLKISPPQEDPEAIEFQSAVMEHLQDHGEGLEVQRIHSTRQGRPWGRTTDRQGRPRLVRLLDFLPGRLLVEVRPHRDDLLFSLGAVVAGTDRALAGFSHPGMERGLKWDLARSGWIAEHLEVIADAKRRQLVEDRLERFLRHLQPRLESLRHSVIHGDANDYNVLVRGSGMEARVSALIDFGDAMRSVTVGDLAVALAYAVLDKPHPIHAACQVAAGYHSVLPLQEEELEVLFPLVMTRLCVSVVNSSLAQRSQPDNPYLTVSQAPAWEVLERLHKANEAVILCRLRAACGLPAHPRHKAVTGWLDSRPGKMSPLLGGGCDVRAAKPLDLSVASPLIESWQPRPQDWRMAAAVGVAGDETGAGAGGYGQARPALEEHPSRQSEQGREWPTVRLGLDVLAPPATPVQAPLEGRLEESDGPLVLSHHSPAGDRFFSLYRGLERPRRQVGETVASGSRLGQVGPSGRIQVQLFLDLWAGQDLRPRPRPWNDGLSYPSQREAWMSICPDPNLILAIPGLEPSQPADWRDLLKRRRSHLGPNLSLAYSRPLHIVRGAGQYLYDAQGRRYLDVYNNVPHVGHCHPRVVEAGRRQMKLLNTNTRYLNETNVRYAERLTATFPDPLKVCYFTASGSEATELALRLARAHSGHRDLIVSEGAYHGHTTTLIDISPYKAEGPGGRGLPDWVHKVPLPDTFRGSYRGDRDDPAMGLRYAALFKPLLQGLRREGRGLCGFMMESIPSCGGQIVLPQGYLKEAYRLVRAAGGLCIADEVQVGFGRVGTHFWGFQTQDVIPDIVALGKPIAAGHPLAAVITTPQIAASFDSGMEFFSTYGGNTVSCAIAQEVLSVIEDENLQTHARRLGEHLQKGLGRLQRDFPVLGDVRGMGLFQGIELVDDPVQLTPGAAQASYLADRLRECGVLTGIDGTEHNVLKLRPPLCVMRDDVDFFLETLAALLKEDGARCTS